MKKFISNYKDKFANRGNSRYVGLKIAGLIVLLAILGGIIYLILSETVLAAELSNTAYTTVLATGDAAVIPDFFIITEEA